MTTKIIYTKTDEAPALATESLLPIVQAFTKAAGINVEIRDISLASRILAHFPENLKSEQKQEDTLAELGRIAKHPEANIIKLPNVSASIPQLVEAVKELQGHGFDIPNFVESPKTEKEKEIKNRYSQVLGSAVNPVLREGNSDRRVAAPVKAFAQKNPHSMGVWKNDSKSHVAHMSEGDFYGSEKSLVMSDESVASIEFVSSSGDVAVLKKELALQKGEVIDGSVMSVKALRNFFATQIDDAKSKDVLFSIHLKATMMKISDPLIFGHGVSVFFADVFEKHRTTFDSLGVDPANGLGDLLARLVGLSEDERRIIESDIDIAMSFEKRPGLAMVDSDRGITNLHVPSDIIIDASMPAAIRSSGQMWDANGNLKDTKFVIPDRCYAGVYAKTVEFCRVHGAFDVTSMGNVANVGLMAQKAEEYGSHDKTFEMEDAGVVRVSIGGKVVMEHKVEQGDIWRMCQAKQAPIVDWVKLAVRRAKATGNPAVFWLDPKRAHDANLIKMVKEYLSDHDTNGLEIKIMSPEEAIEYTLNRVKDGKDTISVTGNVLRDYLTDLFPILELGTSAKMLSIVPLLAGGGLFETGAGGSAPKHVQQFIKEGHLRWDSLGEFLAIGVSLDDLAEKTNNTKARILAKTLNDATARFLETNKSPRRKVGELDSRGSHFFLAYYWAEALKNQSDDSQLKEHFSNFADILKSNESKIVDELNQAQGKEVDLGGYYHPDSAKAQAAMRPSTTFNKALSTIS